jgi:hypothetical protein
MSGILVCLAQLLAYLASDLREQVEHIVLRRLPAIAQEEYTAQLDQALAALATALQEEGANRAARAVRRTQEEQREAGEPPGGGKNAPSGEQ